MKKGYLCPHLINIFFPQEFSELQNTQVKPCLIRTVLETDVQASKGSKNTLQMGIHWYQVSA